MAKRFCVVAVLLFICGSAFAVDKIVINGTKSPDGAVEVACELPMDQRLRNKGGRDGSGLCVFTSVEHAGRWQNVPELIGFQSKMTRELGGGYPSKLDTMMKRYAPGVAYVQYEGRDMSILKLAIKTGRMPAVTYDGRDGHYTFRIAHMVNLLYLDDSWACIFDNNFIEDGEYVWMSTPEFYERWTSGHQGWAVILLAPRPPAPPKN